jgi:uncharacterized protein with HEPN domain
MPSDPAAVALRDIAYHIDLAYHFVAGLGFEAFKKYLRTLYAVTRCLEIISEASRRLETSIAMSMRMWKRARCGLRFSLPCRR